MEDRNLEQLVEHVNKWRAEGLDEYWVRVGYMGGELHRVGDHDLTYANGKLWRRWEGEWRKVERGKDFWLFSVPGTFAWARDILLKIVPQVEDVSDEDVVIEYDETYSYIKRLSVSVGQRASANFDFEVKRFGVGAHETFTG